MALSVNVMIKIAVNFKLGSKKVKICLSKLNRIDQSETDFKQRLLNRKVNEKSTSSERNSPSTSFIPD